MQSEIQTMQTPTLEQLKQEAQRRWPLDPSVQLYWINNQLEAIKDLEALDNGQMKDAIQIGIRRETLGLNSIGH